MNTQERMRFAAGETDHLPPPPPVSAAPGAPGGLRRDCDEADEND